MAKRTVSPPEAGKDMEPHFEEVQAHYDLSDDFFGLFQDPSRTYSCAYYERDDMTLAEAQLAKIDLALGKLELQPGMTLLDIGCGWGSVLKRAVEKYDVNVIGLTLSRNQCGFAQELLDGLDTERSRRILLRGWEQFDEPVDRIVSIEAIEAFPQERYAPFFTMCSNALPSGGRMLLQAILGHPLKKWPEMGIPITMTDLKFMRFIAKEIFPGGSVPGEENIIELSADAGFTLADKQFLNKDYVRTLDTWAEALEAHHDEAVAATSEEVYQRYMKYLTGCSDFFNRGISELAQFTLVKA
ncbi:cyclopropane mycolic acid synthase family methyltransferase [Mycolicibacterium vaccae]|jgi:cyclopropane-fatty-acyl-phospholipid synthase|uniref:Cyclopropane-fatty-acyl-phospholipid synthase n=1 Tax=Mycolicibacterium vaccae ATCC 25954 TaxID=1194972 RepID=K0UN73_MYCVA|nr:cyclopropane mycolic acid synthase family methyltransferase [Mycolicibacterium vaccae]ANI41838.1 SAM-dependent methyltransferase [Mycolicibacterium vaccae 95051]EJZ06465.1 cyclopropane-fatty-acyl-phospholipid synthase [Mycolicibacterium vaccae ATCC 25954]